MTSGFAENSRVGPLIGLAARRAAEAVPLLFLVSGIELVVAACRNGVIGSFPTVNCRSPEQLDEWLFQVNESAAVARLLTPIRDDYLLATAA